MFKLFLMYWLEIIIFKHAFNIIAGIRGSQRLDLFLIKRITFQWNDISQENVLSDLNAMNHMFPSVLTNDLPETRGF